MIQNKYSDKEIKYQLILLQCYQLLYVFFELKYNDAMIGILVNSVFTIIHGIFNGKVCLNFACGRW